MSGAVALGIGDRNNNVLKADNRKFDAKLESIGSDIRDALAVMHTRSGEMNALQFQPRLDPTAHPSPQWVVPCRAATNEWRLSFLVVCTL